MQGIYPRLLEADIIILASPIFFYGITGWAKAMVDRVQALWARKYVLHDPALGKEGIKRRGFFISVGGTKGQLMFEGAILTVRYFLMPSMPIIPVSCSSGRSTPAATFGKIPKRFRRSFAVGRNLVSDLRNTRIDALEKSKFHLPKDSFLNSPPGGRIKGGEKILNFL